MDVEEDRKYERSGGYSPVICQGKGRIRMEKERFTERLEGRRGRPRQVTYLTGK